MIDILKRIATYTILLGIFFGISTPGALADGTETLGDPIDITIASGSGIIAKGIGLATVQPGTINIDIPAGSIVKQVLLYWEGQHTSDNGDNTIIVNGGNGNSDRWTYIILFQCEKFHL